MDRKELTSGYVSQELYKLLVHYPQAPHTAETVAEIAPTYFELLAEEGLCEGDVRDAIHLHLRRSSFFPTVADLVESHRECCRMSRPAKTEQEALPVGYCPEQAEKNMQGVRKIIEMLCNGARVQ